MRRESLIPVIGIVVVTVVFVFGLALAFALRDSEPEVFVPTDVSLSPPPPVPLALNIQTHSVTYDADTQYVGKCSIVTPPKSDPCDAAQGILRYAFFGNLVNANQFKTWKRQNPGEYARLTAKMNAPMCGSGTGLPQDMLTFYGSFIANVIEAYACALGVEPITWPTPNPPRLPGATDKKPPTAPGPITVTPIP